MLSAEPVDEMFKPVQTTKFFAGRPDEFFSSRLPPPGVINSREYIPINKEGQRLDTYAPPPTQDAFDEYNSRAKKHKVCNRYHLSGECDNVLCQYDHSQVSDAIIGVLKYFLRQQPCRKGGACRSIKCYLGHLCQMPDCKGVRSRSCRFSHHAHTMNIDLSEWVVPFDQATEDYSSTSSYAID
jgi:hypothetical protein